MDCVPVVSRRMSCAASIVKTRSGFCQNTRLKRGRAKQALKGVPMKEDGFRNDASSGLSRRELLSALAAAGAGTLVGQGSRTADGVPTDKRPVPPLTAKGGGIDVHHHFRPPIPGAVGNPNWTPEMSLEVMDKYNIAASLLSLTMQREQFYDGTEKGRALIRLCNDFGAKCVQKDPKRLGL